MLEEFDLSFVVQDEALKITSKEKADEILTTKVYAVGDLLDSRGNYGQVMRIITNTIQPDSWNDNGGPGSIDVFPPGKGLVVSQKYDVHEEIDELFVKLRGVLAYSPNMLDARLLYAPEMRRARTAAHRLQNAGASSYDLDSSAEPAASFGVLGGGGGRLGAYVSAQHAFATPAAAMQLLEPPRDLTAAYTANREGLQIVSGLYGANCRVRAGDDAIRQTGSASSGPTGRGIGMFAVP